jgi:hypothetical protein
MSEYKALSNGAVEAIWVEPLLKELGVEYLSRIPQYCGVITLRFRT